MPRSCLYALIFVLLMCFSISKTYATGQVVTSGYTLPGVDRTSIYSTRYGRVDDARADRKQTLYTPADDITHTAQIRAEHLAQTNTLKGVHKRNKKDSAYDWQKINKRFVTNGATGTRFSESVGRGGYSCADTSGTGCTAKLIKAIKGTYIFFMNEEFRKYQPHYLSVVSPSYNHIGLGVAINPHTKRYRIVMHVKKD